MSQEHAMVLQTGSLPLKKKKKNWNGIFCKYILCYVYLNTVYLIHQNLHKMKQISKNSFDLELLGVGKIYLYIDKLISVLCMTLDTHTSAYGVSSYFLT